MIRSPSWVAASIWAVLVPLSAAQERDERDEGERRRDPETQSYPAFSEEVSVVEVAPLPGLGLDPEKLPLHVQSVEFGGLERSGLGVTGLADRRLASVHLADVQGNPFQPDLSFRGFTSSPILGTAQGISVYQDGIRLNEPFGDTVSWDLVPAAAISRVSLLSGSNPLYGLNTLGGALRLETKSGFENPGHQLRYETGSFGEHRTEVETGGSTDSLGYFLAGQLGRQSGWREFSPSSLGQMFGKLGWRGSAGHLDVSVAGADNELHGNGAAPAELLARDRSAVFTHPDVTRNRSILASVQGRRVMGEVVLQSLVYWRRIDARTLNGDAFEEEALEESGPELGFDALRNTSRTRQTAVGLGGQATFPHGDGSHLVLGGSYDSGNAGFRFESELARLNELREAIGSGVLLGASRVGLRTRTRQFGFYATEFFSLSSRWTWMFSARFQHVRARLIDQIGTDLNGDHRFRRLSPAIGATYELTPGLSAYASWSESSRAPSPVELTCADPEDPCRLPNAFVADPPLEQVVTRTWEIGLRGRGRAGRWNATWFRMTSDDDILFVSSGALTNQGHFENVGETRRQGLELTGELAAGATSVLAQYSFLRPTFRTELAMPGPNHPFAAGGEIHIEPGDRIPGIPAHNLKLALDRALSSRIQAGFSILVQSDRVLRGDESNRLEPLGGFAVAELGVSYLLGESWRVAGRMSNLFGARYDTFGLLGEAAPVLGEEFRDPRFLVPAAPRAFRIGVEWSSRRGDRGARKDRMPAQKEENR